MPHVLQQTVKKMCKIHSGEGLKHSLAQLELRMIQSKKDIENTEIVIQAKVQEAEQAPALTSHLGVFNPTGQLSCSPASTPPEVLHPVSDTRKLEGSRNQLQPCPSLQGGASQEQSVRLLGCCDSKGQHAGPNTRPVLRCYHDIPGPTLPRILRTTPPPPQCG
ncbi:hypothetical protein AB1E18_004983 [Capra hircus]